MSGGNPFKIVSSALEEVVLMTPVTVTATIIITHSNSFFIILQRT